MRRKVSVARYGVTAGLVQIVGGDGASSAQLSCIRYFPGVRWKWTGLGNVGATAAFVRSTKANRGGRHVCVAATTCSEVEGQAATAFEAASAESWDA